jgi:lysophospholipase L1-like esterase
MALERRRRLLFRLVTLLAATLLALIAGEVALRLFWGGYYFDEGSLRGRPSALLGWESRPSVRFTVGRPEFSHEATHDRNGFRVVSGETPREKPPGKTRVLCVGDSFTWGYGVGDAATFPSRLSALDPRLETINAGCMGYGTLQELLLLERRGLDFAPDVVVLAFFWNDLADVLAIDLGFALDPAGGALVETREPGVTTAVARTLAREAAAAAAERAAEGAGPEAPEGAAAAGAEEEAAEGAGAEGADAEGRRDLEDRWRRRSLATRLSRRSYLYRFSRDALKMLRFRIAAARGVPPEEAGHLDQERAARAWPLVRAAFARARASCEARGAKLFVVALPDQAQVHPDLGVAGMNEAILAAPRRCAEIAAEVGVPALDLTDGMARAALGRKGAPFYFPRDRHFTPEGHDVAARLILEELRRRGMVPAP